MVDSQRCRTLMCVRSPRATAIRMRSRGATTCRLCPASTPRQLRRLCPQPRCGLDEMGRKHRSRHIRILQAVIQARRDDKAEANKRKATNGGMFMGGLAGVLAPLPPVAHADKSQPLDQRRAIYAPWSPDQMAQRRKEYGLIGPGPTKPVPPPAFPSYLKKPDSIEALMPQA